MDYQIETEKFTGPLDLLLKLVEKNKLDITRLSLAKIADEYLVFVREKKNISLVHLADFLTIASQIILIKSKAILPSLQIEDSDEEELINLKKRLKEYQVFQQVGKKIKDIFSQENRSYAYQGLRFKSDEIIKKNNSSLKLSVYQLKEKLEKVIEDIPLEDDLSENKIKKIISLEEKISQLERRLVQKIRCSFSSLITKKNKSEVVVSFLAILEMARKGIIIIQQEDLFQEIKLKLLKKTSRY